MLGRTNTPRQHKSSVPLHSLISVAALIGCPVNHKDGQTVGKLVDLVCRWDSEQMYPGLSGILVRVGHRVAWIPADEVADITNKRVELNTARLDLRDFKPRPGEARLVLDVLDHQLVDVDGARVVRASDLYIAKSKKVIRLVGVDISYMSLLRRLGPSKWRARPSLRAVIDWSAIQSFGQVSPKLDLQLGATSKELRRLRPAELADLLEDLGRSERQELLNALPIEQAADALEEMQPGQLESLLRESSPSAAASYIAEMETDEAADALRDVDAELRADLISRLPEEAASNVQEVLSHDEATAGGIMNTALVTAKTSETVEALRTRLRQLGDDTHGLEAVVITDSNGKLMHDLGFAELFLAAPDQTVGKLIQGQEPITVNPDASLGQVAELLTANRNPSVLVVDEHGRPLGRILADDVVDFLLPEGGRFHFPRVFS